MSYNTGIHLDEWIDFDNQVHKFYEPVYLGGSALNTFTGHSEEDRTKMTEQKSSEMTTVESR